MNYLDLFSGIGGFSLGAAWAGFVFENHYFSEVDKYAIRIYKEQFPGAIELGDITKINYNILPKGEWCVSGGFPCQPHSLGADLDPYRQRAGGGCVPAVGQFFSIFDLQKRDTLPCPTFLVRIYINLYIIYTYIDCPAFFGFPFKCPTLAFFG